MGVCGDIPFWDPNLTWNTELPTFSRCFRRSMFTLFPMAVFWLVLPFHVLQLRKKAVATTRKLSVLSVVRYLLAGFLGLLALLDLIWWALHDGHVVMDLIEAGLRLLTFTTIIVLVRVSRIYA